MLDSLVIDLIFDAKARPTPEALLAALGGEEAAQAYQLIDPDLDNPRIEMEVSPTAPFRRRNERRLMIIDPATAPMRSDPRTEPVVPVDLRAEKERLIGMVDAMGVRLGRLMALGTWGDAVVAARSARDLRGLALLSWVLDPTVDVDGRRRATPLSQAEFEAKIVAYDKRLDELDERQILQSLGPARFERRGDLLVIDVLEADGTWDVRKSHAVEIALSAIDRFSLLPGAPAGGKPAPPAQAPRPSPEVSPPPTEPAAARAPLGFRELGGRVVIVVPPSRWDLDLAAALGRRNWDGILDSGTPRAIRDKLHADGGGFVARLEFLSEVFVNGTPLTRPQWEKSAVTIEGGLRTLIVHCPRFGPALLVDVPGRGRFLTSETEAGVAILDLIAERP
jgi:hypothetical protein